MIMCTRFHKYYSSMKKYVLFFLALVLLPIYWWKIYSLPYGFWDEFHWVGKSYFFQFFLHHDFGNPVWQSQESYSQPKLAHYMYGVWLYPQYLVYKLNNSKLYDYTQFLIQNGFYEIDESFMDTYASYVAKHPIIQVDKEESGNIQYWESVYGPTIRKPLALIGYARIVNIFLLFGAVIIGYFMLVPYVNRVTSFVATLWYGLNPIIINNALLAHSEALFIFLFNAGLYFLFRYTAHKQRWNDLTLFSLCVGLVTSTKLNGIVLIPIYIIISGVATAWRLVSWRIYVLHTIVMLAIACGVFLIVNPFVYQNIFSRTFEMFAWRMHEANSVQAIELSYAAMPSYILRIHRIVQRLIVSGVLSWVGCMVFISGMYICVKEAIHKNVGAICFCASFVIILCTMIWYLSLDFERYYVPLVWHVVAAQTIGMAVVFQKITRKKLW